jgi:hypothetical protein
MSDGDARNGDAPWWASGRTPEDGIDGTEDPLSAHGRARDGGAAGADGDGDGGLPDLGRLAGEVIEVLVRAASETGRRLAARSTSNAGADEQPATPHEDGAVCEACPVCIMLRAVRDIRPEAVTHLAEAAHHVSLALQAFADAQAGGSDDLQKIDLDP